MNNTTTKLNWVIGTLALSGALAVGGIGIASAGGQPGKERHESHHNRADKKQTYAEPDPVYVEECSSCHMAYPAGLLPARSWDAMLEGLADHFGENAELLPDAQAAVRNYLLSNAADVKPNRRAKKLMRYIAEGESPQRISELKYITRKHHEIPKRLITGNPEVGSLSQCQSCHGKEAERGKFNEDTVDIPGHGRWDD